MDLLGVTSHRLARERADLHLEPGETYVAGGTWLFSEPQPATTGLVDLTSLGWPPVEKRPDDGIRIGATCTIAQLLAWPWPPAVADLAGRCADALLMSFKVRHAATVGGNLCLALPAGAMTALLAALDGQVLIWSADGGERREPVTHFVRSPGVTSLSPGEVVRAIDIPAPALGAGYVLRRIALTPYGRTSAMVIARRQGDGVVLTVTGSTPRPLVFEVGTVEQARTVIGTVQEWYADAHGATDWRAAMTERLAADAAAESLRDPGRES